MNETQENDLRLFLDLLGEVSEKDCEFTDKPDMLIVTPDDRIGVEHTRIYREDPASPSGRQLRPQERIQFQIVQQAFELFRKHSSTPLYLTVMFDEPYNYKTRDASSVATALKRAVLQSMTFIDGGCTPEQDVLMESWDFQRRGLEFPDGVRSFHYRVHRNQEWELWAPSYGYMVPYLNVSDIEAVIEKKEKLLNSYQARCEKVWLLIATDAGMRSSHFDIPAEVTEYSYPTKFERVFLMRIFHRNLSELRTAQYS